MVAVITPPCLSDSSENQEFALDSDRTNRWLILAANVGVVIGLGVNYE